MKKIIFIITILFCSFSNAQNWNTVTQGTKTTLTNFLGALKADTGLIIPKVNSLTAYKFKDSVGSLVLYTDSLYLRTVTGWKNISRRSISTFDTTAIYAAINLKANKSTFVYAGINITGGGSLANDITINADTTIGSSKLATQGFVTRNAALKNDTNFAKLDYYNYFTGQNVFTDFVAFNNSKFLLKGDAAGIAQVYYDDGGAINTSSLVFPRTFQDSVAYQQWVKNYVIANAGTGTVTSVATGYGLTGGTITTAGTVRVDSATILPLNSITLNTTGAIHNSPINFNRLGGSWSGTMSLANQAAYRLFGTGASSSTPSFIQLDTNYFGGNFANRARQWNGGATGLVAATGRTSLGATTVGSNFFTLTNPNAITFPRINADNSVSTLDATTFRAAIGAGTYTLPSFTVGSVLFSDGTTLVQDNLAFNWNNTTKRLRIQDNNDFQPALAAIHIRGNPSIQTGNFILQKDYGADNLFQMYNGTNTGNFNNIISSFVNNASTLSPSAVASGKLLLDIDANGYAGSSYLKRGRIRFIVNGSVTTTSLPTDIIFETGTTVLTERLRIGSGGNIGLGVATPTATLHLKASTGAANTAPTKYTAGVLLSSIESGATETDANNDLYYTNNFSRSKVAVWGVRDVSSTYTATLGDYTLNCTGTFTFTLPAASGFTFREIKVKNSGTGTITVTSVSNIDGVASKVYNTQYGGAIFQSTGTTWIITGTF